MQVEIAILFFSPVSPLHQVVGLQDTVSIGSTFNNHQQEPQHYSFIAMIIDEEGIAIDIVWQEGTVESDQTADLSKLWMPQ